MLSYLVYLLKTSLLIRKLGFYEMEFSQTFQKNIPRREVRFFYFQIKIENVLKKQYHLTVRKLNYHILRFIKGKLNFFYDSLRVD